MPRFRSAAPRLRRPAAPRLQFPANALQVPIFARAGDKEAAREQWRQRMCNRTPAAARREPAKLEVRAAAEGVTEILLYEEIGYWGIGAQQFVTALAEVTTPSVVVRINSPGGDVFDGLAIHNALQRHDAAVTCHVDGLAASIASIIALAGERTVLAANAMMMCHCAWTFGIGNSAEMAELAGTLAKVDGQLAGIYAKKSGKPVEDCAAMMAGEGKADGTWFTATEAKAFGLVDEVLGEADEDADEAADEDAAETEARAAAQAELAARERINAMRRRLAIAERMD